MKNETTVSQQQRYEKTALTISFSCGILLLVWCSWFAFHTNSLIINLDANAYIIATVVDLITLGVAFIQRRKHTRTHPMGFGGYIPLINLLRSCLLISICIQAFLESINSLFHPIKHDHHDILFTYAIVVMSISIIVYLVISFFAKKSGSKLLKTDACEWKMDIWFTLVILVVFITSHILHHTKYEHLGAYIDPIMCIILSIVLVITPIKFLWQNVKTLIITTVEKDKEIEFKESIKEAMPEIEESDIQFKILDVANHFWVDIYIGNHSILTKTLIRLEEESQRIAKDINPNFKVTFHFRHTSEV